MAIEPIDIVNFVEHLTILLCKFVTIPLMSSLLILAHFRPNKLRVFGLSPAMKLYLFTHCICSIMGVPYQLYTAIWAIPYYLWSSIPLAPSPYSPHLLFWTGTLEINYLAVAPIPVTFLALERCMTLKLSTHIKFMRLRRLITAFGALIICTAWIVSTASYMSELPLQLDKVSKCEIVSCMAIKTLSSTQTGIKNTFGALNIILCTIFLYMLRSIGGNKNLKNRIIKLTIIAEILFNVIPGYSVFIFNYITKLNLSTFVGEIAITLCSIDAFICSNVYWHLLKKRKNGANATSIVNNQQAKTTVWAVPATQANR